MGKLTVRLAILTCFVSLSSFTTATQNYRKALEVSLKYFEAQRSGRLPPNQRVKWRGDSGLDDGRAEGVDLEGGYYDAGDNVKYQLPMAFTLTMLAWSVTEYRAQIHKSGQLEHALEAIKWGTDYFVKAHPEPDVLWVEVGDGDSDHACWQRPEDMTTSRKAYKVDAHHPGSEVAGETAAAMAAASIAFRTINETYSRVLLAHAKDLFNFADTYRGDYDKSVPIASRYYPSGVNNYRDELLWAALWLFEATGDDSYLDYACSNSVALGGTTVRPLEFTWDNKYVGVQILAAKILSEGRGGSHADVLMEYKRTARSFICKALDKDDMEIGRTSGGLLWTSKWNNIQSVTSTAFLIMAYADHVLSSAGEQLDCEISRHSVHYSQQQLVEISKAQVDYILGDNPRRMSYMVGYGEAFPTFVHHRGASIVSIKENAKFVGCDEGYGVWFGSSRPNVNVLEGALVGPDHNDGFIDSRSNYMSNEPATYNSAPWVGLLARFV